MDIQGYELHALRGANRVLADNPGIKLLFEFWPYGLKQARASWVELIEALKQKRKLIQQVSGNGLTAFDFESINESEAWYVNLFASPESRLSQNTTSFYTGSELVVLRFLYHRKIKNPRTNTTVVRFMLINVLKSVGRYSNSTSFFPAGRSTPTCHWFTRSVG